MFERKNQNILSEHYNKLVDHDAEDSDDDFITLKRADHELEGDAALEPDEFTSKRKARLAASKKAAAKSGPRGHKLVFDDEGVPHELYELQSVADVFKDADDAREAGRVFAASERGKLQEADVADKAEAKEKKREKKRKRKEREREVRFFLGGMQNTRLIFYFRETITTPTTATWLWARRVQRHPTTMAMCRPSSTCHRARMRRASSSVRQRRKPRRLHRHGLQHLPWRKRRNLLCRCYGAGGSGWVV